MKPSKPYLLCHTAAQADIRFYDGYDPYFLHRRADLVYLPYSRREAFTSFVTSLEKSTDALDDVYFHGLAAELHCSVFQQFEALFALMLAAEQPLPHWIFLTRYTTEELRTLMRHFVDGNFERMTGGRCRSGADVIHSCIYSGIDPPPEQEAWLKNLEDLSWLIAQMAPRYISAPEYNAYKHGLRVLSHGFKLAVTAGKAGMLPVLSMEHAISFLEMKKGADGTSVQEVTKEINPEEAYEWITVMANLADIIRRIRLAGLKGESVEVPMFNINKTGLIGLQRIGRFSRSL